MYANVCKVMAVKCLHIICSTFQTTYLPSFTAPSPFMCSATEAGCQCLQKTALARVCVWFTVTVCQTEATCRWCHMGWCAHVHRRWDEWSNNGDSGPATHVRITHTRFPYTARGQSERVHAYSRGFPFLHSAVTSGPRLAVVPSYLRRAVATLSWGSSASFTRDKSLCDTWQLLTFPLHSVLFVYILFVFMGGWAEKPNSLHSISPLLKRYLGINILQ